MSSARDLAMEPETLHLLSVREQLFISCLWFAFNVEWGALLPIVWPAQVAAIVGPDRKELLNGIALGLGAFVSLIASPVAGALSDRATTVFGRRRRYLLVGGVLNVAFLLFMSGLGRGSPFWVFLLAMIGLQWSANWWGGPYAALIPDLVPTRQRGEASGYMMLMTVVGTVTGAAASAQLLKMGDYRPAYGMVAGVLLTMLALTLWRVREQPSPPPAHVMDWGAFLRSFWLDPRRYRNFYWVLLTRAFITMGIFAMYSYLQYYVADVLHTANPQVLGAILLGVGAAAGLPAAMVAGAISDRFGRKRVIYVTGGLMAASTVAYAMISFHPALWTIVLIAAVFGIGSAGYQAVDWALAIDVLPGRGAAGKDMGIWHIALVLPQIFATPITGVILNGLKSISLPVAYAAVFCTSALWFTLGTVLITRVRGVR